ncbi:MAG: hypothetical protein K0R38_4328 [Polyangiaceae bacterium]|jgi:hypothetical protein|nr:hypothetical protein [Polyangiaceae bacterium]
METNTSPETLITDTSAIDPPTALASPRLRWSAIFGGAVAALGIATLLYALGLALGLSWIDPNDAGSLRPSGIFSGIWLVVVSLVALFIGGYVAARGAGAVSRGSGALHGLVMWGLTVIAGGWLVSNVASAVIRGGAAVGKAAASAVGSAMPSAGQMRDLPQQLGVSSNDMLNPVNQRLRAAGKPEVTAQQLENATKDVLQRSVREGRLDRQTLVQAMTQNTGLSSADAELVATDAETRLRSAQAEMKQQADRASHAALSAAEESSKAFWALFVSLLLGMLAAIAGSTVAGNEGGRSTQRLAPRRHHASAKAQPTAVYP